MHRLHQALLRQEHASRALAGSVRGAVDRPGVVAIQDAVKKEYSRPEYLIDFCGKQAARRLGIPYTRYRSTKHILNTDLFREAEVINLHNLHGHYFDYHLLPAFSARKPIVWTLHDMWAITGHCAYSYGCERWETGCFDCPLLKGSGREIVEPGPTCFDRTPQVWRQKRRLYRQVKLHVAAPSRWLLGQIERSMLAETAELHLVPNGIDLSVFQPLDRDQARWALEVPRDAKVVLFVAEKVGRGRKGFRYLLDALESIPDAESVRLLTVGAGGVPEDRLRRYRVRNLGALSDERLMCLAYNAADLFVFPTLADNQPLVLIEAMACGTPMVAFDVGGVPELVRHMETGYLAQYRSVEDLLEGIRFLLADDDRRQRMRRRCRQIAEAEYSLALQARRYLELYERAVASHPHAAAGAL